MGLPRMSANGFRRLLLSRFSVVERVRRAGDQSVSFRQAGPSVSSGGEIPMDAGAEAKFKADSAEASKVAAQIRRSDANTKQFGQYWSQMGGGSCRRRRPRLRLSDSAYGNFAISSTTARPLRWSKRAVPASQGARRLSVLRRLFPGEGSLCFGGRGTHIPRPNLRCRSHDHLSFARGLQRL